MAPSYITDLINEREPVKSLRSASHLCLTFPKITKTKSYGDRAFAIAAPTVWNNLPIKLRAIANHGAFKKGLKTHLFKSS